MPRSIGSIFTYGLFIDLCLSYLHTKQTKSTEDASNDKEKRKKEVEEKLQVLNEKKHNLVQVLKQVTYFSIKCAAHEISFVHKLSSGGGEEFFKMIGMLFDRF